MAIWFNDTYFSLWEIRHNEKGCSINISNSSKNQDGTYNNDFSCWATVSKNAQKDLSKLSAPTRTKPVRIKASGKVTTDTKKPYPTYFNIHKIEELTSNNNSSYANAEEEDELF